VDSENEGCARPATARFGAYEADFETGELRKHGLRIKIQDKPLRVLQALVERPGRLVTREELRARVWPADVYVDFDRNLKIALNKLRTALCDSAESPRYIETLPRRGYRFIGKLEPVEEGGLPTGAVRPVAMPQSANAANAGGSNPAPSLIESIHIPSSHKARTGLSRRLSVRGQWAAAAVALAMVAAAGLLFNVTPQPAPPPLEFHERDWVLIEQFDNLTSDSVLNGTVQYALARELSNSSYVGIVPPERVQDDLRLMRVPADAPLTGALARQVSLRDGGIRALISGRIEKLGTGYALSAAVVDPSTGAQVSGAEAQARDLNGILPAVHQLSNQLRASLGETLPAIHASNLKLEKVTTPSLRALQLYSQAMSITLNGWNSWLPQTQERAASLLEQALAEDPNFASAHILLANCYSNLDRDSLAAPHYEKAFQLASSTSERERLFILGSYYERFKHNPEKAIPAYEALVRLYPDDYWGASNLFDLLIDRNRVDEAMEMIARLADLQPFDFVANFTAWHWLRQTRHEAQSQRYFARAKSLVTPEIKKGWPQEIIMLESAGAEKDLRSWDAKGALEKTQRLAGSYALQTGDCRIELAEEIGALYFRLGKLRLAQEWLNKVPPDSRWRYANEIAFAEVRGDRRAMKTALHRELKSDKIVGPQNALRMTRLGMLLDSQQVIAQMERMHVLAAWLKVAKSSLALTESPGDRTLERYKRAVEELELLNAPYLSTAEDFLATAQEQQGQIQAAINTLQPLEQQHLLDLETSFHLFQLYEKIGDAKNAQLVEANLLRRLGCADADYPILVQLRREMNLHAELSSKP
jgi:DNA-binding winged helix-turn-helix (wHTH) protein/tetratricopeptide (TPR) repeat protein